MSKILIDDEGENRAVRAFLAIYGGVATVTVENMRRRLKAAGFDGAWPNWANNHAGHLTKAGAQIWIRHLLKLEQPAQKEPETKDVVINNMGKPFTVRAYVTPQAQPAPAQEPVAVVKKVGVTEAVVTLVWGVKEGDKFYTSPQAQPAPVQGWKLVPAQPTEQMVRAYDEAQYSDDVTVEATNVWVAMLAATPQAQPAPVKQKVGIIGHIGNGPVAMEAAFASALAAAPQAQQEPLTDEQMAKAWSVADGEHNASASVKRRITRAIEAAHQIGVEK